MACHALAYDRVGPRPQFSYSPAMKKSGVVWNDKTLDRFLTQPLKVVPGTAMTYDGVADPKERADLIAYLKHSCASCRWSRC